MMLQLQGECSEEDYSFWLFYNYISMATQQTIVIKVGTDVLRNIFAFSVIARQLAQLKKRGLGVILVSSGGVIAGSDSITFLGGNPEDYPKHILASIGARQLLDRWGDALALDRLVIAQFYITYGNLRLKGERESVRSNLRRLAFDVFAIPLVNENDIVSSVEIDKMKMGLGDNDRLARITACLVNASAVVFVTVKGGVYTANPDRDPSAQLISRVDARRRYRLGGKNTGTSQNGTGGMRSKVNQASICARKGMHAGIIGFREILQFFEGESVGTTVA